MYINAKTYNYTVIQCLWDPYGIYKAAYCFDSYCESLLLPIKYGLPSFENYLTEIYGLPSSRDI